jgi:hypothetical protein
MVVDVGGRMGFVNFRAKTLTDDELRDTLFNAPSL